MGRFVTSTGRSLIDQWIERTSGNRVSAAGIVRLLQIAERAPWGETLRGTLPAAGEGTLHDRLAGVTLRAKTGTLIDVSALSGWVWLEREDDWAEFSILSSRFDDGPQG